MAQSNHKLGFWSVFALVTGSQIGSGIFMSPANLAPYGMYSLYGWLISGVGATALALVFGQLCAWFPKTGGPHVYAHEAFGRTVAFFTGWTYWVVSWVSTTIVIIASIGYLTPLIGNHSSSVNLVLEIGLLFLVTALNFRGVDVAGRAEFVLTVLKVVPLVIIPVVALFYFDSANFFVASDVAQLSTAQILSRVTLLTLWGFIGLESATAPAGSVENPSKTIPRAIVVGTLSVALLYVINSAALLGALPGQLLGTSPAPYVDAARLLFGGNWYLMISIIASLICIGTLNAWILTSSQIALGLAQDGLMPVLFKEKNRFEAPFWGLIVSGLGIIPLLVMTADVNLAAQVMTIIDFSVTSFLFVYFISCLSFFKVLATRNESVAFKTGLGLVGMVGLLFCSWIIAQTPWNTIAMASLFTISGIPFYFYFRLKNHA